MTTIKKKTIKTRRYDNFHTFIYRVLKKVDPTVNMTSECKDILNHLIQDLALRYITGCVELCRYSKKITIDSNAIEALTNMWIGNPNYLIDFAHDTWDVYSHNTGKGLKKNYRAGLIFPPTRFLEMFREYRGAKQKIGEPSYIFLTAVIEAICRLTIEQSIIVMNMDHKLTVSGLHVYRALYSKELQYLVPLFQNSFIAGFGTIGNTLLVDSQRYYLKKHN